MTSGFDYGRLAEELSAAGDPTGALMVLWPRLVALDELRRREACLFAERRHAIFAGFRRYTEGLHPEIGLEWRRGFIRAAKVASPKPDEAVLELVMSAAGLLLEELYITTPETAHLCFELLGEGAPLLEALIIGRRYEDLFVFGTYAPPGRVVLEGIDRIESLRRLTVASGAIAFDGVDLTGIEELEIIAGDDATAALESLLAVPRPALRSLSLAMQRVDVDVAKRAFEAATIPALVQLRFIDTPPALVDALRAMNRFAITVHEKGPPPPAEPAPRYELPSSRGSSDAANGGKRDDSLDARLRAARDDVEIYRDYAAWLEARGDPRGELIRIQLELDLGKETAARGAALMKKCIEHLKAYGDSVELTWRRGLVDSAVVHAHESASLRPVFESLYSQPSGRFVREVTLRAGSSASKRSYADGIAALAASATPALRSLVIDDDRAVDFEGVALVRERCPHLDHLHLRGDFTTDDLAALAGLWPSLARLHLDFEGTRFTHRDAPRTDHLASLLKAGNLPSLVDLTIEHVTFGDELAETLEASGLVGRLARLQIGGCFSPKMEALVAAMVSPACVVVIHRYPVPRTKSTTGVFGPIFTNERNDFYTVGEPRVVEAPTGLGPAERRLLAAQNASLRTDDGRAKVWTLTLLETNHPYTAVTYLLGGNVEGFISDGGKILARIADGSILPLHSRRP